MVRTYFKSNIDQYILVAALYMELKKLCRTDTWQISFVKVNLYPQHCVSFKECMRKIRRHVNTGDTYFKDIAYPVFDVMTSVWINLSPESRKLFVGYIEYMKQHMGMNYRV